MNVGTSKDDYQPLIQCRNCDGTGKVAEYVLRVAGVSHKKTMATRCFRCHGTGKVDNPNRAPEPQVINEIPDWMLGEESRMSRTRLFHEYGRISVWDFDSTGRVQITTHDDRTDSDVLVSLTPEQVKGLIRALQAALDT